MRFKLSTALAAATFALTAPAHADPDWRAVAQALGKEGAVMPGGIYRVGLPRSDLQVRLDGVEIKPALALGTWLAMAAICYHTVLRGADFGPRQQQQGLPEKTREKREEVVTQV